MEDNKEFIDSIIKESLSEMPIDVCPQELSLKVLRKVARYNLWKNIIFDFSVKYLVIVLLLLLTIIVFYVFELNEKIWKTLLIGNINILLASFGIIFFIFFLNEITEKYISEKKLTN